MTVKVVIFDFDQTLVEEHSDQVISDHSGEIAGGRKYLIVDGRRIYMNGFNVLMSMVDTGVITPEASKALARKQYKKRACRLSKHRVALIAKLLGMENVYVAVASFGINKDYVKEVFRISFERAGEDLELLDRIIFDVHKPVIAIEDTDGYAIAAEYGKRFHINRIITEIELRIGISIPNKDVMLVDDSSTNINIARNDSHAVLHVGQGGVKQKDCKTIEQFVGRTDEDEKSEATKLGLDTKAWSEDDVAEWLKEIGFGKYAEKFKEEGVVGDILGDIKMGVLEQFGVESDDREKLLGEINRLVKDRPVS